MNLMLVNWSEIAESWIDFSFTGYSNVLGVWVYPLIFMGIIGYVYCVNRSAIAAAVAICIIFSIFGATDVFLSSGEFSYLGLWIVVFSFAGLFTALFIRLGERK